ncbi:carboxypeptidase regulatory-like domain-containing protein [Arenimonas terrae]|uniref:Carboxypeptidase regulatory-like domain-containing protein n=1 Tax=Arenimonas terrae TaxID=2546226 RepID=A0A5C4RWK8_9GAMM|nr:carboxypeptidase regulatory-like domain-containing protein [Arenimonas terrae]TNJ35643.1 carboxypeptidase regulatory-like domain-containing protein [Arenimonas terrae]
MSAAFALAAVLAAIVAAAALRILSAARRTPGAGPHAAARLLAMLAAAALLYFFLLPPASTPRPRALTLLTAGSSAADAAPAGDGIVLALPEAPALPGVARVPDLGTALRRYPGASPLRVRGEGLAARDRDAATGLALEFSPPPLPAGLVELAAPVQVGSGRQFAVAGRVEGLAGGQVELLDPAGARVDGATLDDTGRFRLTAVAGPAGRVDYRLRTKARDEQVQEEIALPLDVRAGAPLRVWLLAGGPGPELKYLRRWARDAGLSLHTQIAVGGGVDLGDPPRAMTPATLREVDLVVIDDRAWRDLGERGRGALRDAVREGLGVLLRLTADPGTGERRLLQEWGFQVETAELARSLRLPGSEAADAVAASTDADDAEARATDTPPLLSRRPLQLRAADGVVLQRAPDGEPFALWRAEGRGRIALWTLSDSFRLVLAGRRAAHGSLWAQTFATLARPAGLAAGAVPENARVGERTMLCAATAETAVLAPDGTGVALAVDPASGTRTCAAYWPAQAGWHERVDGDIRSAFPVRAAEAAAGLAAAERREATAALAGAGAAHAAAIPAAMPGPRWPWGLGWLLASALLWWLERPRAATARA